MLYFFKHVLFPNQNYYFRNIYFPNFRSECWRFPINEIIIRSSRPGLFCKKGGLKNSQNSQENTSVRVFFIRKEALAQVLSCEYLRTTILKNICHRPFMLLGSVQSNLNTCPILNVCYDWHLFCNFLFMILVCKSNHFNLWWYDKASIIWGNYRSQDSFLFVANKVWHSLIPWWCLLYYFTIQGVSLEVSEAATRGVL